ncbi:glycosyltransferase [Flavicella sp.]|nr:glycosyltransferase family 2 protein [Flavicella sp.]MDA9111641.1 glycosyltransferase [Flavicella sp.]
MKISIITIVFNNKSCIAACMESVRAQTHHNIEHVVIDGGSTDGTQEVIAPYVENLGYYVSEKDSGLYNALNKGIHKCTGDVIGILHSDDLFYETSTLAKIAAQFQNSQADLVYANGLYVQRENTDCIRRIYKAKPFQKHSLRMGWIPLHTTIYVKKEVFQDFGLYNEDYEIASDYDISLRWFLEPKIKKLFLNNWVVKMRLGGKSTTAKLQKKKSMEDLKIIKKYNLLGQITLVFKILNKIPQYLIPRFAPSKSFR